ncbi:MAG: hypothetical protein LBI91_02065 [Spirochaetaceae bacterium]|jgi:hypothetical protein|nr:hypothetical protein [Spirochaetaceae bacterium]
MSNVRGEGPGVFLGQCRSLCRRWVRFQALVRLAAAGTPVSGAAGPAGRRLRLIHEFCEAKLKALKAAGTPVSGAAGPAGCRLRLIHEFCEAKLKALKTAWMPFLVQRKGLERYPFLPGAKKIQA